jgi:hypothetical protein
MVGSKRIIGAKCFLRNADLAIPGPGLEEGKTIDCESVKAVVFRTHGYLCFLPKFLCQFV